MFCGIPGSGKTTIARLVATAIGSAVHIQTDDFRFMIPSPVYTREEARFVYESMFLVGREALRRGYDAILDATFLKEDYRDEAKRKLARHYSTFVVVCVLCDVEVARARNSSRSATVPEDSFNRLAASFEKPRRAVFVHSDRHTPVSAAEYVIRRLGRIGGRKTP